MRYGVLQHRGSLTMTGVVVKNTKPAADDPYAGTGVRLQYGTKAVIWFAAFNDNAAAGLALDGFDTSAIVTLADIERNGINPFFKTAAAGGDTAGSGGAEAAGGALLLIQFSTVADNDIVGLAVRDGAAAHFRYGEIRSTHAVTVGQQAYWGDNAAATHAILQLDGFTLTQGILGLGVAEGYVAAADGVISHNDVGLFYQPPYPPYDFARCIADDVLFVANLSRVGGLIPLPCDPAVDPSCPAVPVCPTVPFVCTWCS